MCENDKTEEEHLHKQPAEEPNKTEARLNAILSSMNDKVFEIDLNNCIESCFSPNNEKLYKQSNLFVGERFDKILPDEVGVLLNQAIKSIISGSPFEQFEYYLTIDNNTQWEQAVVTPRFNKSNEIVGTTFACRKIAERKRPESVIPENKEINKTLTEISPVGVWQITPDRRTIYANPAVTTLLELDSNEDLTGKVIDQFFTPEGLETIKMNHSVRTKGERSSYELELIGSRGGRRNVIIYGTPLFSDDGKLTSLIAWVTDITERKKAEEDLRNSEHKVRAILDQSIQFIGLVSTDGTLLDANRSALELVGVSPQEVLNKPFWESPWWNHSTELQNKLRESIKLAALGEEIRFEAIHPATDGSLRYVDFSLRPVKNEQGEILYLIPEGHDITERKKAENELIVAKDIAEENEKRFRNYFQLGLLGMAVTSPTKGIIDVNDFLCEFLEYPKKELIQKTWIELTHPDDIDLDVSYFNKVISGELDNYKMDKRYISKFGKIVYVEMSAAVIRKKDGTVDYFVALINNITERKLAEDYLHQSEARLSALLSSMKDIIFEIDLKGYFEGYYSQNAKELYAPADIFLGKKFDEVLPDNVSKLLKTAIENIYEGKQFEKFEYSLPIDNNIQYENAIVTPRYNLSNEIIGTTVVCRDITESKFAERALNTLATNFAGLSGKAFFEAVSKHIATEMGIDYVYVGELTDTKDSVRVLGGFALGEVMGEMTYALADTPCNDVIENDNCIYPSGIQLQYPEDFLLQQMGIDSYLGARIYNKVQEPIGLLVALHSKPLNNPDVLDNLFRIFLDRTAAELNRMHIDEALHKNEAVQRKMVSNIGDVIVIIDKNGINRFKSLNIEKWFGWKPEEVVGKNTWDIVHPDDLIKGQNFVGSIICEPNASGTIELRYRKKDGSYCWIEITIVNLLHDPDICGLLGNYHDITERKQAEDITKARLSLIQYAQNHSLDELLQKTLDELEVFTHSSIGFYHFVGEDDNSIELKAWSSRTSTEFCNIKGLVGHQYPADRAGIWADSLREKRPVIHNDYKSHPNRKGLPDGHAEVLRELVVPIIRSNRVVAMLGIGNKPSEYTQKDVEIVTNFAEFTWEIVANNRAEEEIRRFKTIADNAGYGKAIASPDGKLIYVNKYFAEIHGYKPEELEGLHLSILHSQKQLEKVEGSISHMIQTGHFESMEIWHTHKDGTEFPMLMNGIVLRDVNGNPEYLATSAIDITQRKKTEDQLCKLSQAIEQSPASVVITNIDGNIEYVNPKFSQLTGYSLDEAQGQNPRVLKSGEKSEDSYKELWQTISSGKDWRGEFHNKKKNGEFYWESASISPIINSEGNITHYLAVKEDITEKKKVELELISAKEKAEESDRLKTAFLQNLSHEIRTPLNGILGFSKLLQADDLAKEDIKEFTEFIQKSSNRLMETVGNVLDISKIETGQIEVKNQALSLNSLMSDLFTFFSKTATTKDVILDYQIAMNNKDSFVESDELKLNQILSNLINNALKFTTIGKIEFGYSLKNSEIEFYVKDSGIGIPDELKHRIFTRFSQVNLDITRGYEGAGLGLSICKGLVELLGGKIWFESQVNFGTTFLFTIPYKPINLFPEEFENNDITNATPLNEQVKILIAEDDWVSYKYLQKLLSGAEYTLIHAENGQEAVDMVKNISDIKLILMDIRMPVMNGIEAIKIIKQIRPDLPIISQTAYAFSSERDEILSIGCNEYISKPIQKSELYKLIEKYK